MRYISFLAILISQGCSLTYLIASLVEIQVGVITANIPSFARMLHHCLPPRGQFQLRLSLLKNVSQPFNKNWSWSASTRGSNSGKPRSMLTRMPHEGKDPFVPLEIVATNRVAAESASQFEMNDLKSTSTIIESGRRESVNGDGIYLKQELEHTWSSIDSNNARIRGERQ